MIRLFLLLLGIQSVRRSWCSLLIAGSLLFTLGVAVVIDALDGVIFFPLRVIGYLMVVQGIVMLIGASSVMGMQRRLLWVRGGLIVLLGLLIVDGRGTDNVVLAVMFGLMMLLDGALRIAAASVVRFAGWRISVAIGVAELVFAVFLLEPYPTHYLGTVPYCIGVGIALTGFALIQLGLRLRSLPPNAFLSQLFSRGWVGFSDPSPPDFAEVAAPNDKLTVHVWTAVGTAIDPLHRPIIERYIAAVDARGVVSTGHAALELSPDVYVSHYPGEEIDRSPGEFGRILRATAENDIPGVFQPSYAFESNKWCESTVQVTFERFNAARLRAFWAQYSQDNTYNLTNRNCSSTVIQVLETALEGVVGPRPSWRYVLRLMFSPELFVAAHLRKRAETMAWTPGLVLDYARALTGALHPPPLAWTAIARMALRTWRRSVASEAAGE